MVEEHIRMGEGRGAGRTGQRRLPCRPVFLHNGGGVQAVHRGRTHSRSEIAGRRRCRRTCRQSSRAGPFPWSVNQFF